MKETDKIEEIGDQEEYVKKGLLQKVKETAAKLPFVSDAVAMYFCALDSKTPLHAKIIAFSALAYFIFPADVIPDIAPIVGYSDDAGSIATALLTLNAYITDKHREKAKEWLNS